MVELHIIGESLQGLHHLVPGDDEPRTVLFELVAHLPVGVKRIVLNHDRADPKDRVERDDVLRTVRHDERDRVAFANAELAQPLGRAVDLLAQLGVRRLASEELKSDVIPELDDRGGDEIRQRAGRQFDVVRHALGVRGDPGARCGGVGHRISLSATVPRG